MKQHRIKQLSQLLLLVLFLLAGFSQGRSAESTADVPADDALKEKARQSVMGGAGASGNEEYRIGYRDILHVSIYGEGSMDAGEGIAAQDQVPEQEQQGADFVRGRGKGVEVRIDGRISLRHIGDVSVVGMTLTQLADYLKKLYSTIYTDPMVTVTLVQSNSQQYTVMGQVTNPGLFHLDFPLTIVKAVARAGGFSEWANSKVTVIRSSESAAGGEGQGEKFQFDYDDFLKGRDLEKNIPIQPGDVIVVH